MRHLFIDGDLSDEMVITGADALHLLYAMRVKPGRQLTVADRNGDITATEVVRCDPQKVYLRRLMTPFVHQCESSVETVLMQCLPKADKMDYIVQKAVELGVNKIIPVISHNCVVRYDAYKKEKRRQKWEKIVYESAKQCGRGIKPEVESIIDFADCLEISKHYNACICYEGEENISFKQYLQEQSGDRYLVIVGPEGGFTKQEIEKSQEYGIKSISLGKRILRTETAATAALAILQYEKGDLGS